MFADEVFHPAGLFEVHYRGVKPGRRTYYPVALGQFLVAAGIFQILTHRYNCPDSGSGSRLQHCAAVFVEDRIAEVGVGVHQIVWAHAHLVLFFKRWCFEFRRSGKT
jgi:hypothetical protein